MFTKIWKRENIFWLVIILLVLFRYFSSLPSYKTGQKLRITSKVLVEPIQYDDSQYIKLVGIRFYLPKYPEVNYGDNVIVEGIIEDGKLKNPVLINLEENTGIIYKVRKKLVLFYHRALPEPHASLVSGLVLGSKANIPTEFWDQLISTGTVHVVVASGMNVTLVAGFLLTMTILILPRQKAVILALVGIWIYALLSGFDAPIIRAAIMGSLAFSAQALGRVNLAWRALFLSALLMLLVNPSWITDLGFILSFVATASLMLFEAKIRKLVYFVPAIFREGLSTSLAAQIGVTPILLLTFGRYSFISPFVNALVLWTVAPITVIGMTAGIVSIITMPIGKLILFLTYPLTSWFIWIVNLF